MMARYSIRPRPHPLRFLFPYTTLFRSPGRLGGVVHAAGPSLAVGRSVPRDRPDHLRVPARRGIRARLLLPRLNSRSEEHTSELQSLAYLVCRLLLEKKNKSKTVLSRMH